MGVRISLYAVDVPPFEQFIDRSLGEVLTDYAARGLDSDRRLWWWDDSRDRRFLAVPGKPLLYADSSANYVDYDTNEPDAFLSHSIEDFLRKQSGHELKSLLRALCGFPPHDFVREIMCDQRRWWIGSLLDYAERAPDSVPGEYSRLAQVWQEVLRPYGCGKSLPSQKTASRDFTFPVIPAEREDPWMSSWTADEASFVVSCFRRIQSQNPRFKAPLGELGIVPETADDWHVWVSEMLESVLRINECLTYEQLAVVSFIS